MRAILTVAAAMIVALAGCSGQASESEPVPTPTEEARTGPVELELGETAHLTGSVAEPRDIDVTITEISVADECRYGVNDSAEDAETSGEGEGHIVEVVGLIDVREATEDFVVPEWIAADADRLSIKLAPASDCRANPESGIQEFSDPVLPGTKARASGEYRVETLPARWYLNPEIEDTDFSWPVPDKGPSSSPSTPAPTAAGSEASADCLVGSYGQPQFQGTTCLDEQISSCGDPSIHEMGTTFFTGGGSGWTQLCADQMLAQWTPPPQPQTQTQPQTNGDDSCAAAICGYGYDENGNPNPSSGEIQTQYGCEQGYITDPELCAAVGVPIG
ncbi:hypothetical protein NCCP2495_05210 [Dietzia sp. NCCP-2495]|nr:hypothetical protein NCCP2495_05210 [Dietzia sp. NCCP-2495]